MKKILWLATGGTISCIPGDNGLSPAADETQMKKMLEITGTPCDTDIQCIMNIDSTDISYCDAAIIAEHTDRAVRSGYNGVVITHGTDTMAYTAAYLKRALENIPIPVILTGSQRPFFTNGSDAPKNLYNSLRAAASDISGVFVLFGDRIMYADRVTKVHTTDDNAFASPDIYAGRITDSEIVYTSSYTYTGEYIYRQPVRKKAGLIKLTPFTDPDEIISASRIYPDGIVIEGFGTGNIPSRLLEAVHKAVSGGCRVLLISQCPFGNVSSDIYAVGNAAVKAGAVSADMSAEAALAYLIF